MKTTLIFRSILILCLISFISCSKDSVDENDISGIYQLKTVNGRNLPFIRYEGFYYKQEILSGSLKLNFDKSYTSIVELKDSSYLTNRVTLIKDKRDGIYSLKLKTITFSRGYWTTFATINRNSISAMLEDFVLPRLGRPLNGNFDK